MNFENLYAEAAKLSQSSWEQSEECICGRIKEQAVLGFTEACFFFRNARLEKELTAAGFHLSLHNGSFIVRWGY